MAKNAKNTNAKKLAESALVRQILSDCPQSAARQRMDVEIGNPTDSTARWLSVSQIVDFAL
jgi:hypothetical protein